MARRSARAAAASLAVCSTSTQGLVAARSGWPARPLAGGGGGGGRRRSSASSPTPRRCCGWPVPSWSRPTMSGRSATAATCRKAPRPAHGDQGGGARPTDAGIDSDADPAGRPTSTTPRDVTNISLHYSFRKLTSPAYVSSAPQYHQIQPEDDFFTPAARTMRSPVAVEPVMEILRTRGSATSASPRVSPGPVRTDSNPPPGGRRRRSGRPGPARSAGPCGPAWARPRCRPGRAGLCSHVAS
jgi:hypothetical protein